MIPAAHGEWLAGHLPNAEPRIVPGEGHISVLNHASQALAWLRLKGANPGVSPG